MRQSVSRALAPWFVAAVVLTLAPASAQPPEDPGLVKAGESLYGRYCTSCHGATAEGDGRLAGSLRPTPSNLTLLARDNGGAFPFQEVVRKIDGTEDVEDRVFSDMPTWGRSFLETEEAATDEQVRETVERLAHYLRSVQTL